MPGKHTIQEIARRAGVGVGTVARALNGLGTIGESEREAILRAIRDLDYRPSLLARPLRTKRSQLVGFISDEASTTPFAGAMIQGAQAAAWARGRILTIMHTGRDAAVTRASIEAALEHQAEGIVYAAMFHHAVELPEIIYEAPTVLCDCYASDRSLPSVVPDEVAAGRAAVEALLQAGHRRIGFINLTPAVPAGQGRLEGYKQGLAAYGIDFDELLVRYGHGGPVSGYVYARELLSLPKPPSALFCGNDQTAMGAYDAIRELSLRIPDDVAVIGIDNLTIIAAELRPALTTLQLPHYDMGAWAVNYLLDHLDQPEPEYPIQHRLPCPLVVRESI